MPRAACRSASAGAAPPWRNSACCKTPMRATSSSATIAPRKYWRRMTACVAARAMACGMRHRPAACAKMHAILCRLLCCGQTRAALACRRWDKLLQNSTGWRVRVTFWRSTPGFRHRTAGIWALMKPSWQRTVRCWPQACVRQARHCQAKSRHWRVPQHRMIWRWANFRPYSVIYHRCWNSSPKTSRNSKTCTAKPARCWRGTPRQRWVCSTLSRRLACISGAPVRMSPGPSTVALGSVGRLNGCRGARWSSCEIPATATVAGTPACRSRWGLRCAGGRAR